MARRGRIDGAGAAFYLWPMVRIGESLASANISSAAFWRDARLARLIAALNGGGEETRVVGGAVRDALLGKPVADVDLATTATPDETIRRAKAAGFRTAPTGVDHGTVTVIVEGKPFEVTTLREDIETDGRHAKVRFGRDFEADALRRDFTVNALSADAAGRVYDYAGGLADIAARKIRFIGDARQRAREDYLRIVRFFRFHAWHGEGPLDREGLDAAIAERGGLARLARERIRAEMLKTMTAPGIAFVAREMSDAGILGLISGGVAYPERLRAFIDIERAREIAPDPLARLGALLVVVEEDAARLAANWRLSNAEAARLRQGAAALVERHGQEAPPPPGRLRETLMIHGRRAALDAVMLAQAEAGVAPNDIGWTAAWRFLSDTPEPRLPFSGADLMARGVPAGRGMGETLKRLQALWIRAGFPSDPQTLSRLLEQARE